ITLTTTSANGCSNSVIIPVTIHANPTVSVTPTHVSCNGLCNGQITALASGSSGYNYNWSGAGTGTTANLIGLCPGNYSVTITDVNGCMVTGSGEITQPAALAMTATSTNVSCNGTNDGAVSANNATGGTAPYTYSWDGCLGTGQFKTNVAPVT